MIEQVSEEVVTGVAQICGPYSAAAKALKEAERRRAEGQEVVFFKERGSIIVAGRATKEK